MLATTNEQFDSSSICLNTAVISNYSKQTETWISNNALQPTTSTGDSEITLLTLTCSSKDFVLFLLLFAILYQSNHSTDLLLCKCKHVVQLAIQSCKPSYFKQCPRQNKTTVDNFLHRKYNGLLKINTSKYLKYYDQNKLSQQNTRCMPR